MNTINIIGLGKMGTAIAKLLIKTGYTINAYDIDENKKKTQKKVVFHNDIKSLLSVKAPVIAAVKPSQMAEVLAQITDNRLVISIAAGVNLQTLNNLRKVKGPVIRVMPNTPFLIGKGISVLCADSNSSELDKKLSLEIFQKGGDAIFISDEKLMHTVTSLSGSGPAFVEIFLQSLEDAGVLNGLSRDLARLLALKTTIGTAAMVEKSGKSPYEHIFDVTSPGGTTIAGIKALKENNFENAVLEAVEKAVLQSKKLAKEVS
ncbi:MAG: pyrroline-5-carboxylate reductase [Spirochaetia bacterium]|nr:pyrroline-5-carboxylate reductase [Spirochaetia bacterium]